MTTRRQPALPPKIAGFEYVGLLGMGGFADVFEYRQDFPRRSVAVKVLLDSSLDAGNRDAFFAEANIMAGLSQHPSIVTIHQAAIASDGRPYFVMEYCSRPSLGARFRTERISIAETLRTGIRVASAIETAHRLGILHRDIKPANILATDFGWPALTDFGIAGAVGELLVASGMSIPWAPPELLADEPIGDARSDVYSLAATLYSLLAGRTPFEVPGKSNSPIDLITRIEREPLKNIERVDVPQSLNLVIARAMAKNPEHRFSSALAFAHALQAVEREMQLPVTSIDVTDLNNSAVPPVPQPHQSRAEHDRSQARNATESSEIRSPQAHTEVEEPDDSDEATRLRGLITIEPQEQIAEPANASDIETRLRPVTTISTDEIAPTQSGHSARSAWSPSAAQQALAQAHEAQNIEEAPNSKGYFYDKRKEAEAQSRNGNKRLMILLSVASVLLLVATLLFIGRDALGTKQEPKEIEPTNNSTPSLDTGSVPAVKNLRVGSETDTNVRFVWENPQELEGDTYVWKMVDVNEQSQATRTEDKWVDIPREATTGQICVEVSLVRSNGKMSNTATRICST